MTDFDTTIATEDFVLDLRDYQLTWTGEVDVSQTGRTIALRTIDDAGRPSWLNPHHPQYANLKITRRLRMHRPAGEGIQSILLTYASDRYTTPRGEPARQQIELWAAQPFTAEDLAGEDNDALARLSEVAADVWTGSHWDHWWIESVALDGVVAVGWGA